MPVKTQSLQESDQPPAQDKKSKPERLSRYLVDGMMRPSILLRVVEVHV